VASINTSGFNGCSFCAPLFVKGTQIGLQTVPLVDGKISRNGTVTFIEFEGACYAVTCWHVISDLRSRFGVGPENEFVISRSGFYPLLDRFVAPDIGPDQFDQDIIKSSADAPRPIGFGKQDIAIRPIPHFAVGQVNKKFINISTQVDQADRGLLGSAFGFPELGSSDTGSAIKTECGEIIGQLQSRGMTLFSSDSLLFRSEATGAPAYGDFSGFSGGPVFVSPENPVNQSFLGILYEGIPPTTTTGVFATGDPGKYPITFRALVVTPQKFSQWIVDCRQLLAQAGLSEWWGL
jgi:hypothetical protein